MDVGLERGDHDDSGTNILRNIKDVGDQRRILFGQHNFFFTSHSHGVSVSRDNIIISTHCGNVIVPIANGKHAKEITKRSEMRQQHFAARFNNG